MNQEICAGVCAGKYWGLRNKISYDIDGGAGTWVKCKIMLLFNKSSYSFLRLSVWHLPKIIHCLRCHHFSVWCSSGLEKLRWSPSDHPRPPTTWRQKSSLCLKQCEWKLEVPIQIKRWIWWICYKFLSFNESLRDVELCSHYFRCQHKVAHLQSSPTVPLVLV